MNLIKKIGYLSIAIIMGFAMQACSGNQEGDANNTSNNGTSNSSVYVKSAKLNSEDVQLDVPERVGGTTEFTLEISDILPANADDKAVTWQIVDSEGTEDTTSQIIAINATGNSATVTAKKAGVSYVKATVGGDKGKTYTATVSVKGIVYVKSAKLNSEDVRLDLPTKPNGTTKFTLKISDILPEDADDKSIVWEIIDKDGKVDTSNIININSNTGEQVLITSNKVGETRVRAIVGGEKGKELVAQVSVASNNSNIPDDIAGSENVISADSFFVGGKRSFIKLATTGDFSQGLNINVTANTSCYNQASCDNAKRILVDNQELNTINNFAFNMFTDDNIVKTDGVETAKKFFYQIPNTESNNIVGIPEESYFKLGLLNTDVKVSDLETMFGPVAAHKTVVFKNKLYLIGGKNSEGGTFNHIYETANGLDWHKITPTGTIFSKRYYHGALVINAGTADETLFVIGGVDGESSKRLNDVWQTKDMQHWTRLTEHAAFSERSSAQFVSFQNKIWVIGGFDSSNNSLTDVYNSENGTNWTKVGDMLVTKSSHKAFVFNHKLWVAGGGDFNKDDFFYNSADGITWQKVTAKFFKYNADGEEVDAAADFEPRWKHQVVEFKHRLWIIGGAKQDSKALNDIWSSVDGENWYLETEHAVFNPRCENDIVVYGGLIWFTAGKEGAKADDVARNDIWFSTNAKDWYRGFKLSDVFKK